MTRSGYLIPVVVALAACSGEAPPDALSSAPPPPPQIDASTDDNATSGIYLRAVASSGRSDEDRARDENRRPAEILEFFHIEPGMTVLDMFSGGGYYTEILSQIVGIDGTVFAQNNAAYIAYVGDEIPRRYADNRLPNVIRLDVEAEDVDLPPNTLDAALLVLGYHDLYAKPGDGSWPEIDGADMLGDIYRALRPGGVFGVVDHRAAPGSDKIRTATELHRIEEKVALCEIEQAGFAYDGSLDILDNPDDDLSIPMYADGIKGQTSRFVIRFHKPIDGSEEEGASGLCD